MHKPDFSFLKTLSILYVEDNIDELKSHAQTFELFFGTVYTAQSAKEARKIFKVQLIDVIITDFVLSDMQASTLIESFRLQNSSIPIIVVSNYSDQSKLLSVIDKNLTDYVIKPLDKEKITQIITKLNALIAKQHDGIIINENTKYYRNTHTLDIDNTTISLTKNEDKFLQLLLRNKTLTVTYEDINVYVFQQSATQTSIKNLAYSLRQKIGKEVVRNIKGVGFVLV